MSQGDTQDTPEGSNAETICTPINSSFVKREVGTVSPQYSTQINSHGGTEKYGNGDTAARDRRVGRSGFSRISDRVPRHGGNTELLISILLNLAICTTPSFQSDFSRIFYVRVEIMGPRTNRNRYARWRESGNIGQFLNAPQNFWFKTNATKGEQKEPTVHSDTGGS